MLTTTYQNGHSTRVGAMGERIFERWAQKQGWTARKATRAEDMRHIDYFLDIDGVEIAVDVKGLKRGICDNRVLIELLNVNGDKGWLFGEAFAIAFQIGPERFLFVEREKLAKLVNRKMGIFGDIRESLDHSLRSFSKFCPAPRWYRRADRMDAITNICLDDLVSL